MSTRRCSLAVKMIASCEMDHRSVDFFIHPRRSSFIDSNWLDQSRDLMFLPLIYYNSNFFFCIFCFAMPFFCKISPLHQLLLRAGGSLTQIAAHWKQRTVFFASDYFTPAYIITSLAHRRFGIFLSNMTCGVDGGSWHEFQTIFVCYFASLSYFGSLPIHFTLCSHWRTTARNEQFSELAAIEVIQRGGLCRIGV